jgi:hypothetical protein
MEHKSVNSKSSVTKLKLDLTSDAEKSPEYLKRTDRRTNRK